MDSQAPPTFDHFLKEKASKAGPPSSDYSTQNSELKIDPRGGKSTHGSNDTVKNRDKIDFNLHEDRSEDGHQELEDFKVVVESAAEQQYENCFTQSIQGPPVAQRPQEEKMVKGSLKEKALQRLSLIHI